MNGILSMQPEDVNNLADGIKDNEANAVKRVPRSFNFNGNMVTYPQYLRLKSLQNRVIKLDQLIEKLRSSYPNHILEQMPKWHQLKMAHKALSGMLPESYNPELLEEAMMEYPLDQLVEDKSS